MIRWPDELKKSLVQKQTVLSLIMPLMQMVIIPKHGGVSLSMP